MLAIPGTSETLVIFLCVCVMDSELSKGYIPFEFCTARNIIPLYKRVFASDERSTVERL